MSHFIEEHPIACPKCGSFKNERGQWVSYRNVKVKIGNELCPPCVRQEMFRNTIHDISAGNKGKELINEYMKRYALKMGVAWDPFYRASRPLNKGEVRVGLRMR